MANNEIPKTYDPLIELMEDAADGAATHGVAVGLKQSAGGLYLSYVLSVDL